MSDFESPPVTASLAARRRYSTLPSSRAPADIAEPVILERACTLWPRARREAADAVIGERLVEVGRAKPPRSDWFSESE